MSTKRQQMEEETNRCTNEMHEMVSAFCQRYDARLMFAVLLGEAAAIARAMLAAKVADRESIGAQFGIAAVVGVEPVNFVPTVLPEPGAPPPGGLN